MTYSVIENRNIGTLGNPIMHETVLYRGNKEECLKYEEEKRKEYKDRTMVDCYTISDEQQEKSEKFKRYWDSLSKEEKEEKVVIDGKTYFKAASSFTTNNLTLRNKFCSIKIKLLDASKERQMRNH